MTYVFLFICAILIALDWAGAVINFRAGNWSMGLFSLLIGMFLFSVSVRMINRMPRKPKDEGEE